jgi:PAS domain S-box-containing protein
MTTLPKIYFERLLEMSPDIVIAVDREGKIVFYNDGAEQTLGYTSEELLGEQVATKVYPDRETAKAVMKAMREGTSGEHGGVKNHETVVVSRSGERIPIAISGTIIRDEKGREIGSIGFAKDIREIRRRDQLATMGELAVSLAHEINNPLEAIGNNLDLVSRFLVGHCSDEEFVVEGERLEAIQRELEKIQGTLRRMQSMVSRGTYGTRVYLPGRLMTDLDSALATTDAESESGADGVIDDDLGGARILVVDDDLGVCHSLRDVLQREHCEVRTASGGLEALEVLERYPADVVLSDVVMPDMDGYDLYMELKERKPETPVVLMTAYYFDKDHVIKRSRLEGLDQVIFKKPINPGRLKTILTDALRRAGKPARSGAARA